MQNFGTVKAFFIFTGWFGLSLSLGYKYDLPTGCAVFFFFMLILGIFGPTK